MNLVELNNKINKRLNDAGINPFSKEDPNMVLHPEYIEYKLHIAELSERTGFIKPKPSVIGTPPDDGIDSLFD